MSNVSMEKRRAIAALNQTRWWEKAACAGAPFDLFDADKGDPDSGRRVIAAGAICDGCPVRESCRADADLIPDPSFRAGYTAVQRKRQNRASRV